MKCEYLLKPRYDLNSRKNKPHISTYKPPAIHKSLTPAVRPLYRVWIIPAKTNANKLSSKSTSSTKWRWRNETFKILLKNPRKKNCKLFIDVNLKCNRNGYFSRLKTQLSNKKCSLTIWTLVTGYKDNRKYVKKPHWMITNLMFWDFFLSFYRKTNRKYANLFYYRQSYYPLIFTYMR